MKLDLIVEILVTIALLAAVYTETGFFTVLMALGIVVYMWREARDVGYTSIIARVRRK